MSGLDTFVMEYPGLTVVIFAGLWAVLVLQGQAVFWFVKREIRRIENKEVEQNGTLRSIQTDVHEEEGELKLVLARLDAIDKHLEEVKGGVSGVSKELKDHNCEAEGWKRKITAHEVRLDHLEGK